MLVFFAKQAGMLKPRVRREYRRWLLAKAGVIIIPSKSPCSKPPIIPSLYAMCTFLPTLYEALVTIHMIYLQTWGVRSTVKLPAIHTYVTMARWTKSLWRHPTTHEASQMLASLAPLLWWHATCRETSLSQRLTHVYI